MSHGMRLKILAALTVVILSAVFFVDPIAQDPSYHQFSDVVEAVGIPNVWNVLSNIPFVMIGVFGFIKARKLFLEKSREPWNMACLVFYIGLVLTGFGSAYYHLSPTNETLLWDRLPMTISFMAFFSFIVSLHINQRLGAIALWPLLAIGMASVFYWSYTEGAGFGDLRFYAVVQFLPIILIPFILIMFPVSNYQQKYMWLLIALYVIAKLMENFDVDIHLFLGISGHTIKHVVAAFSGIAFLWAISSISRRDEGVAI